MFPLNLGIPRSVKEHRVRQLHVAFAYMYFISYLYTTPRIFFARRGHRSDREGLQRSLFGWEERKEKERMLECCCCCLFRKHLEMFQLRVRQGHQVHVFKCLLKETNFYWNHDIQWLSSEYISSVSQEIS